MVSCCVAAEGASLMSQRIGITLVIALCSCSTTGPDSPPPSGTPDTGVEQAPPAPDLGSLPSSARLVPEPVDSVEDVPGQYVQPLALPGQVSTITIGAPSFGLGSYDLYRSCGVPTCVPENGQYSIVAINAAIGFAALSLVDQSGTIRVTYILDYLWRDSGGALVAIQLRALIGNATGPTQVWWRLPDGTTAPTDGIGRTVAAAPQPPVRVAAAGAKPSVAGVFVRALPIAGDVDAITLDDAVWSENTASGTFHASYPYCVPWCFGEDGDYELDLANIATGTGELSLVPAADPSGAH